MAFAGRCGLEVAIHKLDPWQALFSETPGVVVQVPQTIASEARRAAEKAGLLAVHLGSPTTEHQRIQVNFNGKLIIDRPAQALRVIGRASVMKLQPAAITPNALVKSTCRFSMTTIRA